MLDPSPSDIRALDLPAIHLAAIDGPAAPTTLTLARLPIGPSVVVGERPGPSVSTAPPPRPEPHQPAGRGHGPAVTAPATEAVLAQRQPIRPSLEPPPLPGGPPARPAVGRHDPLPAAPSAHPPSAPPVPGANRAIATAQRLGAPASPDRPAAAPPLPAGGHGEVTYLFPPVPGAAPAAATASTRAPLAAVQRQDEGGGGAPSAAASPPSVTPAPAATPPGGAAPGTSDADLDELGRRLYPRIRDHLKAELTIDRERAGLLNDLGLR